MLLLILIALAIPAQNQSPPKVPFDDHAIVTPRKEEWTRGKGEDRDTQVLIHPVVTGLRPEVLKKVRKELEVKRVMRGHYIFYRRREMFGYEYRVTYNRNHILAITFSWNAYFANHEKPLVFDLRDGSLISVQDLFLEDKIPELAKLVDQKLQAELQQMIRDYEKSGSGNIEFYWKAENASLRITPDDLAEIAINDKGITFFYDAGFHHSRAWAEPEGRYFLMYSDLKPFLKPDSVVSQFVK